MMGPSQGRRRWRSEKPRGEGRVSLGERRAVFAGLGALILILFGALTIQLIRLQIIHGDEYVRKAEINTLREVQIPAARGLIYDRNGVPLALNAVRFSAAIVPGDLPERGAVGIYRQVERVIGVPAEEIEARVKESVSRQGEYVPAIIKSDLDRETALILRELEPYLPGVRLLVEPTRRYPAGALVSHILGYVGPISAEEYERLHDQGYLLQDYIGKAGVERYYEGLLRGRPGRKLVEVDAVGRELRSISERRAIDGANLVLSIDLDLQKKTAEILEKYAEGSDNAAAVVMDVRTGEVLAMVSLPGFDNNIFSRQVSEEELADLLEDPAKPLVNHAIAEMYQPGSTFKTIVGAAALQEGVATPGTVITSRGYITVRHEYDPNAVDVFRDWAALGPLDFYGGLAMSSDVYFYYLAGGKADEGFRGLGVERLARYSRAFGLGEPTGIDLPGESAGFVPDAEWKEREKGEVWYVGDTYNFGIGQGYLAVTPLQLLTAVSAVANGGELLRPHLVKEVRDSQGNVLESFGKEVRRRVPVDPAYLRVVREAMRQSVTRGVARTAAVPGLAVAGKTGTAEFGERRPDGSYETHGWFVGFAPYEDPQVAVVVFVQRGSGGRNAAPAGGEILRYYFQGPRMASSLEEGG